MKEGRMHRQMSRKSYGYRQKQTMVRDSTGQATLVAQECPWQGFRKLKMRLSPEGRLTVGGTCFAFVPWPCGH